MNNIKQEILTDIKRAVFSIQIATAWFTDEDFISTLIEKKSRTENLLIEIVLSNHKDNKEFNLKSKFSELIKIGAIIKTYGSNDPQLGGFMHAKFYIIDDSLAKSGSFNWSRGASRNIECLDIVDLKSKQQLFRKIYGNGVSYLKINI